MRRSPTVLAFPIVVSLIAGMADAQAPATAPGGGGAPSAAPSAAADAGAIMGAWAGSIDLPGMALKVAITFSGTAEAPTGTIDIPLQGAKGLALEKIRVEGSRVSFALAGIPGDPTFNGTREGDRITGDFTQAGGTFKFELRRGELDRAKRPQTPKPPYPYTEEAVSVKGEGVSLAGTLTRPPGAGPFPAVVLISGSGPQNRDEELFDHRPFAVIADALTRAGNIVLRYDDRGVGGSTGDMAAATTTDLARDAELWVPLLRERKDISKIGLLGHSEGGIIAPMIAARNADVAFVIMLAGPGVSGAEILAEQSKALVVAAGGTKEQGEAAEAQSRKLTGALAAGEKDEAIIAMMREIVKKEAPGLPDDQVEQITQQQARAALSPWYREFVKYDPRPALKKVRVPVLALNGEKDAQVVPAQNLPPIEGALREGGNADVTVREMKGLNHLFQPCTTGAVAEYAQIEQTMDPAVLELIREWTAARFGGGR